MTVLFNQLLIFELLTYCSYDKREFSSAASCEIASVKHRHFGHVISTYFDRNEIISGHL